MTPPAPATEPRTPHAGQSATGPRVMLTVEQAAAVLGIGRTNMYALIKSGEIESVRIGRLRRVPADAIDAYTARLTAEQNPAPGHVTATPFTNTA